MSRTLPGPAHKGRASGGEGTGSSSGPDIGECPVQGPIKKIMHGAALAKPHLVLGWMDIDIDLRRVDLEMQNEGRMAAVMENILKGLANGMSDQSIPNHPPIHEEILEVGLASGKGRRGNPTTQLQTGSDPVHTQRMVDETLPDE